MYIRYNEFVNYLNESLVSTDDGTKEVEDKSIIKQIYPTLYDTLDVWINKRLVNCWIYCQCRHLLYAYYFGRSARP